MRHGAIRGGTRKKTRSSRCCAPLAGGRQRSEPPLAQVAQDKHGNVSYFGERTVEYVNGHPRDNGSWEAGVNGAMHGVALPAKPKVGMSYREEYAKGIAEDQSGSSLLDGQASEEAVALGVDRWTPTRSRPASFASYMARSACLSTCSESRPRP